LIQGGRKVLGRHLGKVTLAKKGGSKMFCKVEKGVSNKKKKSRMGKGEKKSYSSEKEKKKRDESTIKQGAPFKEKKHGQKKGMEMTPSQVWSET